MDKVINYIRQNYLNEQGGELSESEARVIALAVTSTGARRNQEYDEVIRFENYYGFEFNVITKS